jgi:hypothetical protein
VLRRLFGLKKNEVTGELRKLHNKLCDLYSSPNIIRVMKSRRMRWAGHVARKGEKRNAYILSVGRPQLVASQAVLSTIKLVSYYVCFITLKNIF